MTEWYAPNQQAVRGDHSGGQEQGDGGSMPDETGVGGGEPEAPPVEPPPETTAETQVAASIAKATSA